MGERSRTEMRRSPGVAPTAGGSAIIGGIFFGRTRVLEAGVDSGDIQLLWNLDFKQSFELLSFYDKGRLDITHISYCCTNM